VEVCVFENRGQFGGRYDDQQSWERHEQDMERAEIARERRRSRGGKPQSAGKGEAECLSISKASTGVAKAPSSECSKTGSKDSAA
jgi:hypothetical protein